VDFLEYRQLFENKVVAGGVQLGCLGMMGKVSTRIGRLSAQSFGKLMGLVFESQVSCAVDYYGHIKKSTALLDQISRVGRVLPNVQIKMIPTVLVHFSSIRIEKIARLAPDLVAGFPLFKKTILDARGFSHGYEIE